MHRLFDNCQRWSILLSRVSYSSSEILTWFSFTFLLTCSTCSTCSRPLSLASRSLLPKPLRWSLCSTSCGFPLRFCRWPLSNGSPPRSPWAACRTFSCWKKSTPTWPEVVSRCETLDYTWKWWRTLLMFEKWIFFDNGYFLTMDIDMNIFGHLFHFWTTLVWNTHSVWCT